MKAAVVIGGGASGMMAALTAAEKENIHVILIERQQRVGRKLLATGNGRCNLTNIYAGPANYHGEQPGFADFALEKFTPQNTLDFFAALGLVTVTAVLATNGPLLVRHSKLALPQGPPTCYSIHLKHCSSR